MKNYFSDENNLYCKMKKRCEIEGRDIIDTSEYDDMTYEEFCEKYCVSEENTKQFVQDIIDGKQFINCNYDHETAIKILKENGAEGLKIICPLISLN